MNIIDAINNKVAELVALGLTDENKVRRALSIAVASNPSRNSHLILQHQAVLMEMEFYGGDTKYLKGEAK